MKKLIFILLLSLGATSTSFGQYYYEVPEQNESQLYIGAASGINSAVGLIGPTVEYKFSKDFSAHGGVGLGSWGYKLSGGSKYYFSSDGGWALNLSFSLATGLSVPVEVEMTSELVEGLKEPAKIPVRFKPASTLNFSVVRHIALNKSGSFRLNLEAGYALPITYRPYEVLEGYKLTSQGHGMFSVLQPGGLLLSLGFSVGIN